MFSILDGVEELLDIRQRRRISCFAISVSFPAHAVSKQSPD
jgi:hypothetical protein